MVKYLNITYKCNSRCIFCAADIMKRNSYPKDMTADDVLFIILSNDMKENDRIILNGGEPTLCDGFEDILSVCKGKNIIIDLFTNGIRFCDKEFTSRVIENGMLYIRIPLFGLREKHDYLTGIDGNYEKTMCGIENISEQIDGKRQRLDIKFLLSKTTVETNLEVLQDLKKRKITEKCVISLNPLLISNSVIEHKELFIDDYSILMNSSRQLFDYAIENNIKIITPLIPICTIPKDYLSYFLSCYYYNKENVEYYMKTERKNNIMEKNHCVQLYCNCCEFEKNCPKFPESYLKYYKKR